MVSDQLKAAIEKAGESGRSYYRVALDAGMNPSILAQFMKGARSIKLVTVDQLCNHLGLELKPIPKGRK